LSKIDRAHPFREVYRTRWALSRYPLRVDSVEKAAALGAVKAEAAGRAADIVAQIERTKAHAGAMSYGVVPSRSTTVACGRRVAGGGVR